MFERFKPKQVLLFLIVPALALTIAARQFYLSNYYDLSTWKGGGMGMFAGADSSQERFLRVYIKTPDGRQIRINEFTQDQVTLETRAVLYPVDENFRELAVSLRNTVFVSSGGPSPVIHFSKIGKPSGETGQFYFEARANSVRATADAPDWTILIEFWKLSYSPTKRILTASLSKSMKYKAKEL